MANLFRKLSKHVSNIMGQPSAFVLAGLIIIIWALLGPIFHFSDTWQLVINTGTTIITFLMVFLIQNTQNRDTRAIHLKLDELIRSNKLARNTLIDLEELSDEEMDQLHLEFSALKQAFHERAQEIEDHRKKRHPHRH